MNQQPERLLSIEDVLKLIPISRGTLWRWCRDGILKPPKRLADHTHRVFFLESDIQEFINKKAA